MAVGALGALEAENGRPFPSPVFFPDDLSVGECGGFGWLKVVVEIEVEHIRGLVAPAEIELAQGRFPLCREEEGGVVDRRIDRGFPHLFEREVGDTHGFDPEAGVAEFRMLELRGAGPGGQNGRLREALRDDIDCLLMQNDQVAVGEVVLGSEGVGRVEPDCGEEGSEGEAGYGPPETKMAAPFQDTDQENQRVEREEVTGKKSATEDGEGQQVCDENGSDGREQPA